VKDALRLGGVTICAGRLAGAGSEWREARWREMERPMFISGLWQTDHDDENYNQSDSVLLKPPDYL
jgi:hypothetical protein